METSLLNRIQISVMLGFLLSLVFAFPLWMANHNAPIIGALPFPRLIPIIAALFFLLLIFCTINSKPIWKWLLLVLFLLLSSLEFNFLQPYYYQYLLFIIILALNVPKSEKIRALQWILIGTYVWSGLHKFHPDFIYVFPRIISYAIDYQSWINSPMVYTAYIIPLVELGLGLALISKRFRSTTWKLLVGMHLWIILNASPLLLDWNYVIIPWNLVMIFQLVLLFSNTRDLRFPQYKKIRVSVYVILGLPIVNFLGYWPHYQSFDLYSGKGSFYSPEIDPDCSYNLPLKAIDFIEIKDSGPILHYNQWYEKETGVFPIPEDWYYPLVKDKLDQEFNCRLR